MPSNIEIKARVEDLKQLQMKAAELSGTEATILQQEDTFFNVPQGRLKLRQIKSKHSELIYYERTDTAGPKQSIFNKTNIEDPEELKEILEKSMGIKGRVKKTRYLYMVGQTRVHVDSVDGLGSFMELEVMMQPEQTVQEGEDIAQNLMLQLGISKENLIEGAYMDLILKNCNGHD